MDLPERIGSATEFCHNAFMVFKLTFEQSGLLPMGCSACGSVEGKVLGCKSNGGCSTGSCNRMNAYDWLSNLPFTDPDTSCRVVEVSFNHGSRKDF